MTSKSDPTSVKAAIENLLEQGIYDNRELLEKSGANSLDYVRKVKSEYFRRLRIKPMSPVKGEPVRTEDSKKSNTISDPFPPLSPADRRALWTEFEAKTTLPQVVIKFGFHASIVLAEFEYYLKMQGISVPALQEHILEQLAQSMDFFKGVMSKQLEEYSRLVSEFKSRGQVGLPQYKQMVRLLNRLWYNKGKLSINNLTKTLPKNWQRPICSECQKPVPGVILDTSVIWGMDLMKSTEGKLRHRLCPT